MSKPITRGVLLIATTHPYFGRMAANLAMTLKVAEPGIQIAILADDIALRHLNDAEKALFTDTIPIGELPSGLRGINALRMRLPELTPFDETLALDVDMLWLQRRKPSEVFELLRDRDFTIVNEGFVDLDAGSDHTTARYSHWADLEALKAAYGLTGNLYQVRGEFLVFRKSAAVSKMYRQAKAIQRSPKVAAGLLAGSVTDEFALNIALNKASIEPHVSGWQPAYWPAINGNLVPAVHELHADYYAISFGGNTANRNMQRAYGIIAGAAAYKLGLQYRFRLQSKHTYLTERIIN